MKSKNWMTAVLLPGMILAMLLLPGGVLAEYPERAVTVIAPHPAGGDTDQVARAITEAARKDFPKGIAVVNRAGGGGTIGIGEVVRARPDGYTLGSSPIAPLAVGPHRVQTPYKDANDYQPIIRVVKSAYTIAVLKDKPWKNFQELLAYSKANPGKIRMGMAGEGTISHLAVSRLLQLAKVDMTVIPFTGGVESVTALLGGHIDVNCQATSEIIPHVQAGNARLLVSMDEKRSPSFPDLPTLREGGLDVTCIIDHSIIGPKGLSPAIVSTLHNIFKRAMNDPVFIQTMEKRYYSIAYEGPEDLKKRLIQDYQIYGKLLQELGLTKK
jgi:tripartite-type tricarboxylate transporter receptor subunit TctC